MSDFGIGVVAGCCVLIAILVVGIFSDWYNFGDERRVPLVPHQRAPHPVCVYEPPGRC